MTGWTTTVTFRGCVPTRECRRKRASSLPILQPSVQGAVHALLGVEPYADQPYYVGYRVGEQEIGLDPNGHRQGLTGPIAYWNVADIEASLQSLLDAGATTEQGVHDVGGGNHIAWVKDADGNIIGLRQTA